MGMIAHLLDWLKLKQKQKLRKTNKLPAPGADAKKVALPCVAHRGDHGDRGKHLWTGRALG